MTALLLLISSLLFPIAPLLEASVEAAARDCQCCQRLGAKCSRLKPHSHEMPGPSRTASPQCGNRCGQPGTVAPARSLLAAQARRATEAAPEITESVVANAWHQVNSSYPRWLYQRPPPLS